MLIKAYSLSNNLEKDNFLLKPAEIKRDWMTQQFYKCLPLSIGNQFGWNISCPCSFKAIWNGNINNENAFKISFKNSYDTNLITSHFGNGILTFKLPYLFRTEKSYGLFVRGPTNHIKFNITYLDAFIETDWLNIGFTYNIKFQKPNIEVEFKKDEPLLSIFPFDLEIIKNVKIEIAHISEDSDLEKNHRDYLNARKKWVNDFHSGKLNQNEWMKDYYLGENAERKSIGCPFLNIFGKYIHNSNLKLNHPYFKRPKKD